MKAHWHTAQRGSCRREGFFPSVPSHLQCGNGVTPNPCSACTRGPAVPRILWGGLGPAEALIEGLEGGWRRVGYLCVCPGHPRLVEALWRSSDQTISLSTSPPPAPPRSSCRDSWITSWALNSLSSPILPGPQEVNSVP